MLQRTRAGREAPTRSYLIRSRAGREAPTGSVEFDVMIVIV